MRAVTKRFVVFEPSQLKKLTAEAEKLSASLVAAPKASKKLLQQRLDEVGVQLARHEVRVLEVARQLQALEARRVEGEWLVQALRNFDGLWQVMTPEKRQRLVAAVVEKVVVTGDGTELNYDLKLADLGGAMERAS